MSLCSVLSLITIKQYRHHEVMNRSCLSDSFKRALTVLCTPQDIHQSWVQLTLLWNTNSEPRSWIQTGSWKFWKQSTFLNMQWLNLIQNQMCNESLLTHVVSCDFTEVLVLDKQHLTSVLHGVCHAPSQPTILLKHPAQTGCYCLLRTVQSFLLLLKHHGLITENKNL